jgi:hypothetical protein
VENVVSDVPYFSECNATPTTRDPNTIVICRDSQDNGGWSVNLRASPSTSGQHLAYLPKFNTFSVVGGPTYDGSQYYWYHLQGGGYDGWAAFLEIDSGNATNPTDPNRDFSWSFTRIKLQASSNSIAENGSPNIYIYLSPPTPPPPTTTPTINSVSPSPGAVAPGGTFTINASVSASQTQPVLLGASLFPAGTTQNEIDDSAHDISWTLYSGNNSVSRSFTVPVATQSGTYDLVFAVWQDVNGDRQIDAGDTELASKTVSSALTVTLAPPTGLHVQQ